MSQLSSHHHLFLAKPSILTGESISGYVARAAAFASEGGIDMTMRYQEKPGHRLAWLLPSGLQQLSELYGPSVPSAEELLARHTVFPVLRPFLPEEVVASLRDHFLNQGVPGIALACGLSPRGLEGRWALAVCKKCVADDSRNGVPFWRTAHFIPGLTLCPFHLEPLYTYCGKCMSGFRCSRQVWLPGQECLCGAELHKVRVLSTEKEYRVEAAVATMARQILGEQALDMFGQTDVLRAISRRASELGYGGNGGAAGIQALLEKRVGATSLEAHGFAGGCHTNFRCTLSGTRLPRHPIPNLLLIHALFGGLDDFLSALSTNGQAPASACFYRDGRIIKRRPSRPRYRYWYEKSDEELHELRLGFRSWLQELKSVNPNLTRRQLNLARPHKAYLFLRRFDREWLDIALPCSTASGPSEATRASRHARQDHLLATHICVRYQLLMRSPVPIQVTHRRLLEGHPLQSVPKHYFERFPNTKSALATYTESAEAWRQRQLRALLAQASNLSSNAPFQSDLDLTQLSCQQIKVLKAKIRKWLKKQMGVS